MAVKATVREDKDFKKWIGYRELNILPKYAVNPTLDQLKELGFNFDKEPEYIKEVEDKDKATGDIVWTGNQLTLVFYFNDKEGGLFNVRFYLKDKLRNPSVKGGVTKFQYINSDGWSSYAESEGKLPEGMTKDGQSVRRAYDGESDLIDFLKTLLNKADYKKGFGVSIDNWKKLMKGDVKEILDIVSNDSVGSILAPLTIKNSDGKVYQQVFNKGIIPGYAIKNLNLMKGVVSDAYIDNAFTLKREGKGGLNVLQKSILAMEDSEWGCKDSYFLGIAKEYKEEEDFVQSGAAIQKEVTEDEGDY